MESKSQLISQTTNELLIIVFFGGIGMGKTTFTNFLKSKPGIKEINFLSVSSDIIAKEAMQNYKNQNPGDYSTEVLFIKALGLTQRMFEERIDILLKNELKEGKNIFVIDHARLEDHILAKIDKEDLIPGFSSNIIGISSDDPAEIILKIDTNNKKEKIYPFSYQMLLNKLWRIYKRKNHETIVYSHQKNFHLIFSFIKIYEGMKSPKLYYIKKFNWKKFLEIEFYKKIEISEKNRKILKPLFKLFDEFINVVVPFEHPFVSGRDLADQILNFLEDKEMDGVFEECLGFGSDENWNRIANEIFETFSS